MTDLRQANPRAIFNIAERNPAVDMHVKAWERGECSYTEMLERIVVDLNHSNVVLQEEIVKLTRTPVEKMTPQEKVDGWCDAIERLLAFNFDKNFMDNPCGLSKNFHLSEHMCYYCQRCQLATKRENMVGSVCEACHQEAIKKS